MTRGPKMFLLRQPRWKAMRGGVPDDEETKPEGEPSPIIREISGWVHLCFVRWISDEHVTYGSRRV
jgi:hypothetical protein